MIIEIILGFDAREIGPRAAARWTEWQGRTDGFLLRDVPLPLSVDEMVWPSAFAELPERRREREASELRGGGTPAFTPSGWIPRPAYIGPNGLWDDLGAMEAQIQAASKSTDGHGEIWEIAITWHGPGLPDDPGAGSACETIPAEPESSWRLLGFDIADPQISGLTNCGYTLEEREALAPTWAHRLNEHHLFPKIEDADAFRLVTNERVPEHAPFFVFGLWRVGALNPPPSP